MRKFLGIAVALAFAMLGLGCSSSKSSPTSPTGQTANVFVTGEDAPLPSVVGFDVTINSITLTGGTSPEVLSTATTVDFARLLGLRSPLAFNSVPAGTYTGATFALSTPVISYVDMSTNPPSLNTINGTFNSAGGPTTTTVSVSFPSSMVVGANGLAGLRMDFDIRQSVAVDGSGNVTGVVNPVIYARAVKATDSDAQVTDLVGGLASVDASANSFVIQGPYGHQLTIDVNSSTQFNTDWTINNLATPATVGVQGYFQADGTLMASSVEVITTSQAFISGRVLAINPTTGPVQQITMFVGETSADLVSDSRTIQTVDVSAVASSAYDMCFFNNLITDALFNSSHVLVGQRIFIGGNYSNSVFTPQMISLRLQGVYGTMTGTPNVVNINLGNFELQNNALIGYSLGDAPLTVWTGNGTLFINTTGLSTLTSGESLVAGGLLFYDALTGGPIMAAGVVVDPPPAQ
ncbi:MAG: DUF5666 domain-containing protein [Candidatus Sulfotelmatobacter sp.]